MKARIFVYGTLKKGQPGNRFLAGQEFLGPAQTCPRYRLYDLGPYPCLAEEPARGVRVRGEVWAVDEPTLRRLDQYEGVPALYARKEVALEGFGPPVWGYVYQGDVSGLRDCGEVWP